MFEDVFKLVYLIGLVTYTFGLSLPNMERHKQTQVSQTRSTRLDLLLVILADTGQVITLVYIFTPWLDWADYHLAAWLGFVGVLIFTAALCLLASAHGVIGRNFSPKLEVGEQQTLITQGVYRYIRHPIYAGFWLWGIAQPLLLQNWIAGWVMLVTFIPLYWVRVPHEEQVLLARFGEEYQSYIARTGRVIPRLRHGP